MLDFLNSVLFGLGRVVVQDQEVTATGYWQDVADTVCSLASGADLDVRANRDGVIILSSLSLLSETARLIGGMVGTSSPDDVNRSVYPAWQWRCSLLDLRDLAKALEVEYSVKAAKDMAATPPNRRRRRFVEGL